jgi:hypothetical protein
MLYIKRAGGGDPVRRQQKTETVFLEELRVLKSSLGIE